MKKICSVLLILCMLALTFTACGGGKKTEFMKTMDEMEAFFVEYTEFMEEYAKDPTDTSKLQAYTDYLTEYSEMMTKLAGVNIAELSEEDAKYYQEVQGRINAMIVG